MNNQKKYTEDLLEHYINPERIEKAPEGFTSKVMSRIQVDGVPVKSTGSLRNISPVALISTAVTVVLIVAVLLIPGSKSSSIATPVLEYLKNIKFSLPEIDLTSIFRFNIPVILIYVSAGILILLLFDVVLYGLFHREK